MGINNVKILFLIAWVGLACAGIISLLVTLVTKDGSLASSCMALGLSVIFFLLWKDAKRRS